MSTNRAVVLTCLLALVACQHTGEPALDRDTDGPHRDADSDSDGDSDTDTDSGTAANECPEPIAEACADGQDELPILVDAAEFGTGTRLVSMGEFGLLAVREQDDAQTVVLYATVDYGWSIFGPEISGSAELDVASGVEIRAVGLVNPFEVSGDDDARQVALICLDEDCRLYVAQIAAGSTGELVAMANGAVPCGPDPAAIVPTHSGTAVCVFGRGVCCFDGSDWTTPIEPEPGLPLLAAAGRRGVDLVAVGRQGRLVSSASEPWSDGWSADRPDFVDLAIGTYEETFAIAVEGGALAFSDGVSIGPICPVADEELLALAARGDNFDPGLFGVTASGRIFRGSGDVSETSDLCFTGQEVVDPIDVRIQLCGIGQNQLVLTPTALYGEDFCAID